MSDLQFAAERVWAGIHMLAEGRGRICERLADAYVGQVSRAPVSPDLPEEARQLLAGIHDQMTVVHDAVGPEGRVRVAVRQLSEDEAVAVAGQLLRLGYLLQAEGERQRLHSLLS